MKFILKDDFIYIVNSTGIMNNKVEAEVFTEYVEDYELKDFAYRINAGAYKPLVDNRILFTKADLKDGYIDLDIRAMKDGIAQHFRSDKIPVTYGVMFGKTVEEAYPEALKTLFLRMDRIDKYLIEVLAVMEVINSKGDLL